MLERGLKIDHSTINRWVLAYSPELVRHHLRPVKGSYRIDETYIKVIGTMNMIRKGQIHGVPKGDILSQVRFVSIIFELA